MNSSATKQISIFLFFVIIAFGIYSNTLETPFCFDDKHAIQNNLDIRITKISEVRKIGLKTASTRPIAIISFALNYYLHQYDLKGYHIVNIAIHILTGIFLLFFIKTTLTLSALISANFSSPKYPDALFAAFGAALIWLVHPVQTQSVTYIVQRMTSMAAMFFLLSFLLYVKGRIHQRRHVTQSSQNKTGADSSRFSACSIYFAGSILAWLLALGSKQTSATLPFFIFIYEWYFFQDLNRAWLKRHLKYVLGIAVLFGFIAFIYLGFSPLEKITSIAAYHNKNFTFTERVLTQFRVVIYYLSLLFYPHPSRLNLDYDFPLSHSLIDPSTTLFSLLGIVGLIGLAVLIARKERLISFCILWFFGNLVIESTVIPLDIIYEHRTYLPSMLVILLAVLLTARHIRPKWLIIGILCSAVMICSMWTYERNRVWDSQVTLWEDCVKKSPNKARPHYNLGVALEDQGTLEDAVRHYTESLRINPVYIEAHNNLGNVLVKMGRLTDAIGHYSEALSLKPDFALAHNNLGNVFKKKGLIAASVRHYIEALRIDPDYAEAHNNLGTALVEQGRINDAIQHYSKALELNPDYAEAHNNLGNALAEQGRINDAIRHYSEALRINPEHEEAHTNLGIALAEQGHIDDAVRHYFEALRINPDYAEAHNNLGTALAEQKRLDDAIQHFSEALRINPDYAEAHDNLGTAFAEQGRTDEAIDHYKKALAIQPDFTRSLNNLAIIYMNKEEYDQALPLFKRIIEVVPDHSGTYYNIACLYALQHKIEASIDWLKQAIEKGYDNWDLIKTDKDLENIKKSNFYKELVKHR